MDIDSLWDYYLKAKSQKNLDYKWKIRSELSKKYNKEINQILNSECIYNFTCLNDAKKQQKQPKQQPKQQSTTVVSRSRINYGTSFYKKLLKLFSICISNFNYIYENAGGIDRSIGAILAICNNKKLGFDVDNEDDVLTKLSRKFNDIFLSGRNIYKCYDCGTVARGIFYALLNEYRGSISVTKDEIHRMTTEYTLDYKSPTDQINDMRKNLKSDSHKNSLTIVSLQLGDHFGHTFVIERTNMNQTGGKSKIRAKLMNKMKSGKVGTKTIKGGNFIGNTNLDLMRSSSEKIRMYQGSFRSYLLSDYIEYMDYLRGKNWTFDVDKFADDMIKIMITPKWVQEDLDNFLHWYNFKPPKNRYTSKDIRKFTSCTIDYYK